MKHDDLLYQDEVYQIIGCAMKVHSILGPGFHESVYKEALAYEFTRNNIPFVQEQILEIRYDDIILNKKYAADFVCYEKIIVEAKALSALCPEHESQVINYLKATSFKLGVLINFGEPSLKWKRIIYM
jgi:GxxExxY protein